MQSTTAARVVAIGLTASAVVVRLASNFLGVFNFSAIGALGLFGGARLKWWQAYLLPLALMAGTDLGMAVYRGDSTYGLLHPSRIWVYGCFAIYVLIGQFAIGDSKNPFRIGAATLLGAVQFYLITNFCEWLWLPNGYPQDVWGLLASYAAGIPFFRNQLAGDAIFTSAAFALQALLSVASAPVLDEELTPARS